MRKWRLWVVILLIVYQLPASAQIKSSVTGRITDSTGLPLPGTSVQLKAGKAGASADERGFFKLEAPANSVLVFSAVGYQTKELNVGSDNSITVTLTPDRGPLSEIVVTGTGAASSRKHLGFAMETVNAADLPQTPGGSVDQALIGKVAGAQISGISGNPGDPVNIVLRGINTVQQGTQPLILLDGVSIPMNDLNIVALNSIARVELVEGAASAAIYGAQGANGVIQLFTKQGKRGAPRIEFSSEFSANQFINSGHVHKADRHPYLTDAQNNIVDGNSGQPLQVNDLGVIEGLTYTYGGAARYALLDPRTVFDKDYGANLQYHDHFKEVFQTATSSNNSLSVSGGSDKADYFLSFSNAHNVSVLMKNGAVDRTNLLANLGVEAFKGFHLRSTTQLIYTTNSLHPDLGAETTPGLLGSSLGVHGFFLTSPFFDLRDKLADHTSPIYQVAAPVSINSYNPFYVAEYSGSISRRVNIMQQLSADYRVNRFLELSAVGGLDFQTKQISSIYYNQSQNANSNYYQYYIPFSAPDNTGQVGLDQYTVINANFLGSATFRYNLNNQLRLPFTVRTTTLAAVDYRKSNNKENFTYGVGLPLEPPFNLSATAHQAVGQNVVVPFVTYGYLLNERLDFGDFAGLGTGFRSDWSSAFGRGSTAFVFPHVDGYFLISGLWKNSEMKSQVPLLKIRAAYGEAGTQPGPFDRYPTLNETNLGNAVVYSIPSATNNPDLQVEVSKEFEAGTDLTLAAKKQRTWFSSLNASLTFWTRRSYHVIYAVSTAPATGSNTWLTNAIDMSSHGIEFSLTMPVYNSKTLKWLFTANFNRATSYIDRIAGGQDIILNSLGSNTAMVLTAGKKIGQLYGYKALTNLDFTHQDGTPYIAKTDDNQYTLVDGRVVNKTTKQIQFTEEAYPLGDPNPKFNVAFINSVSFKDLINLSFQFDWIYGSHLYNQTKEFMYRDGISGDFTRSVDIAGQTGAFSAYWASPYYNGFENAQGPTNQTKDFFWEKASFLRLRNISLSLNLGGILGIRRIKRIELILSGRNILTVTRYTGLDPEVSSGTANSSYDRGVDNFTLPNIKSYQAGLNLTF